jgi:hypothetical protein
MSEEMSLVDDLADVLSHMVVGWKPVIGADLAEHPEVVRVMARYRKSKGKQAPFTCTCECHLPIGFTLEEGQASPPGMRPCKECVAGHEQRGVAP